MGNCQVSDWIQKTPLLRGEIEKCFARNFFYLSTGSAEQIKLNDSITICDNGGNPCVVGRIGAFAKSKNLSKCKRCCGDHYGQLNLRRLNSAFLIYDDRQGKEASEDWVLKPHAKSLISHFEDAHHACKLGIESMWLKPCVGNVVAIFQCPGYREMRMDRLLVDDTGCNFIRLLHKIGIDSVGVDSVAAVNASPIPHYDGFNIADGELAQYSSCLRSVIESKTHVICFGERAYKAYSLAMSKDRCVDNQKKVAVSCHLSPTALHHLRNGNHKVTDEERIVRLAGELRSFLRGDSHCEFSTTWEEFKNISHGEFTWGNAKRGHNHGISE